VAAASILSVFFVANLGHLNAVMAHLYGRRLTSYGLGLILQAHSIF